MKELSEDVVVSEAEVFAGRVVEWFRERLRIAETERDAADLLRTTAEDQQRAAEGHRRVAEAARDEADQRRIAAEGHQRTAEAQRNHAQRRVVQVEELLAASDELAEQLQQALDSRIVIEQAKGMLAERHRITPDAAFEAMRQHARNKRLALHDVAAELMAGTAHLDA